MKTGFDLICRTDGGAEFRLYEPEAEAPGRSPLVSFAEDPAAGLAAALLGRLHYRDEALARLPDGMPAPDSDAGLALATCRDLGPEGLGRLEGEFALVVWDGRSGEAFARRDPFGSWPLFRTVAAGGALALSTSLDALRPLRPGAGVDLEHVAEFLMCPTPYSELPCERSAFDGISRVLPGALLRLGRDGRMIGRRDWDWAAEVGPRSASTAEEAGEQFAGLFREAVRERLRAGRAMAHLSGGMDSTGVACVARDLVAAGEAAGPLSTLSLYYERPQLIGERAYAEMITGLGGPIDPHFVRADTSVDFDWFDRDVPAHDEPYFGLQRIAMDRLWTTRADDLGVSTILSGLGSDEMLDGNLFYIADLFRAGRPLAALAEASRWARSRNQSLWSVLKPYGLEPFAPVLLHEGPGALLRGGFGRWPRLGLFAVPPWVRPRFAAEYGLRARAMGYARKMFRGPTARSVDLWSVAFSAGDWIQWHLTADRGIAVSHPFRDPRLVRFCLGLEPTVRCTPGRRKPVLQEAMKGILPEPIRTRRDKAAFNAEIFRGLSKSLPDLERMVRGSAIADLGLFDADRFVPVMREAAMGVGDVFAFERMHKTLALVAWFDRLGRPRPARVPSAKHRIGRGAATLAAAP